MLGSSELQSAEIISTVDPSDSLIFRGWICGVGSDDSDTEAARASVVGDDFLKQVEIVPS